MSEQLQPLHDRIVVKRSDEEKMSSGGIVIPDSANEKPCRGEVIGVGGGKVLENGKISNLSVSIGDTVLFTKFAGTDVTLDGNELLVMREEDVIAVIEE